MLLSVLLHSKEMLTTMKIGEREVIWSQSFICPENESVEFALNVDGKNLPIKVHFTKDDETKKSRIEGGIEGGTASLTFTNWETLSVMTPFGYKVAVFNNKLIRVAAHGTGFSGVHHVFMQFMMEDHDD